MDNQHKMIKGYRDLTQTEIDLMNRIKAKEVEVMALLAEVKGIIWTQAELSSKGEEFAELKARHLQAEPARWAAVAKTDLQLGFMSLVRAVAQPQSPNGN